MTKRAYYLAAGVAAAIVGLVIVGVGGVGAAGAAATETPAAKPAPVDWAFNATIIEACSCTMFCPCYFSTKPVPGGGDHADHGMAGGHYCRFNMAYKVNKGHYGATDLAGAKVWIAGDLGEDFGNNTTEWAEATFDPSVSKAQRDGIAAILLGPIYPFKWKTFTVGADAPIEWTADKARAQAKLGGGQAGEIILAHNPSAMNAEPTVIKNLKYFGAPRNEGFVLMPNEVEAYRRGDNKFEYKGTNGFMITLDMTSKDVK
ncbi:MAG TPA: DUF1326 domain-containing protein [Candidatus Polarisedimenticolia bacterium]|nr:DUF1326 domain-containing protein [Candidatus Polarisedimenticolia bacterium]